MMEKALVKNMEPQAMGLPEKGYPQEVYPTSEVPIQTQPTQKITMVVVENTLKPSSYMALSCFVYWCCNFLFGSIAFALSLASNSAADDGDMESARSMGRASKWVSIAGIIISVVAVVIVFTLYLCGAAVFTELNNVYDPFG